jgi:hypothetical protein
MVDLRKKPYQLNEQQIEWVNHTLGAMTLEEKIGQLFIVLKTEPGVDKARINDTLNTYHQGGLRWQGGDKETVYLQNTTYQKASRYTLAHSSKL